MNVVKAGQHDIVEIIAVAAPIFHWRRVCAEIAGGDADRPDMAEQAGALQHLHFTDPAEPIAGFDLDRGDAFAKQRIEPRQGFGDKLLDRQRIGRLDRGDDAAAGPGDLLIGRAGQAHLEFAGPIAAVNDMGVAVDETGGDPAAFEIDDLGLLDGGCRQFAFGAGKGDAAVFSEQGAFFDDAETRPVRRERRQPRITPQYRPYVCGWGFL